MFQAHTPLGHSHLYMCHHSVVQSLLGHCTSQVVLDPTKCAKPLVALVAGISKTSETTVQTCDISSRWACERSLKNCTIDLKVWRFPDSDEGILFVNTSK